MQQISGGSGTDESGGTSHHPLPASDKARHDEGPETIERDRSLGDDDPAASEGELNRGSRPGEGSGAVTGSGAGAGGGGGSEDYDADPQAGGGGLRQPHAPRPREGGDAPSGGSH